ncbi:MAG: DinB family protein [Bacteroidota bacterium]|nr:DinB family protein [Bacteroidota bacterium]
MEDNIKSLLNRYLDYNLEMTLETAKFLIDLDLQVESSYSECWQLLIHTVHATNIWYSRIANMASYQYGINDYLPGDEAINSTNLIFNNWKKYIAEANLFETLSYTNLQGKQFESILYDVVLHLNNHCTHHRAQIMHLLRVEGHKPLVTDFIAWSRKELAAKPKL